MSKLVLLDAYFLLTFHLLYSSTMKTEALRSSKRSVDFYGTITGPLRETGVRKSFIGMFKMFFFFVIAKIYFPVYTGTHKINRECTGLTGPSSGADIRVHLESLNC